MEIYNKDIIPFTISHQQNNDKRIKVNEDQDFFVMALKRAVPKFVLTFLYYGKINFFFSRYGVGCQSRS